jgi:hypothetical protein
MGLNLSNCMVMIMAGIRMGDIERMHRIVDILGKVEEKREVQVWKDVAIFGDLFPEDKSSVEIIQELRKKKV